MGRTVWIDLENSPHVPFFLPWISWLREIGHEVFLTARDLSQTHDLLRLHNVSFEPVGGHGGGGRLLKAARSSKRALDLGLRLRGKGIALALGHGSRAQALAAYMLGIPCLSFIDYEYVSLRPFGFLCRRIFFPDAISADALTKQGIPLSKIVFYPGFKEQVYLDPARDQRRPVSPPLIIVRPPARRAHYHTPLSELLYRRLVARLAAEAGGARVLFLPRYEDDRDDLLPLIQVHSHFVLPDEAVRGRDILLEASLVVSGGGTMIREAAILGVPAASFFGGPVGGVDRALSSAGRLRLLRTERDVDGLPLPGADVQPGADHLRDTQYVPGAAETGSLGAQQGASIEALADTQIMRDFLKAEVLRFL